MNLYCKTCNTKISTQELNQVSSKIANLKDGMELTPPGTYILASEIQIAFKPKIDFLLNQQSVDLVNHRDSSKLHGCCGPSNLNDLNQVCPNCSAEIGVLIADCLFSHFVGISMEKLSTKPIW